jgi:predicted aspartyl protease
MKTAENSTMGRFKVAVELANNDDILAAKLGHLDPGKIRRVTVEAVVDSGATRLVLPAAVARQLGLVATDKVGVRYADGRRARRDRVQGVYLKLLGRDSVFSAAVEPKRDTVLLGAIVLEELDFLIDCTQQRLVPRDPKYIISEIESID